MVVWFAVPAVYYVGVLLVAAVVGTGVMTQIDNDTTIEDDGPLPVVPIFDPGPIDPVVVEDPTEDGHPNVNPEEDDNGHPNENPDQNEHPNENPTEDPVDYEYENGTEPGPMDPTEPDIYMMPKSSFGIYAEPPVYDDRAAIAFILTFVSIFTMGMFVRKLWRACR